MNRENYYEKKFKIKSEEIRRKELSNIEKLFLNYKGKYEKIDLGWDNEVGKEIWYKDKREK